MVDVDLADLTAACSQGFEQATAEKVVRLLGIPREVQALGSTKDRFTLKGGTALNVFHFPKAPRRSVDIDLMATGVFPTTPRLPRKPPGAVAALSGEPQLPGSRRG